jgi:hypothetical protein
VGVGGERGGRRGGKEDGRGDKPSPTPPLWWHGASGETSAVPCAYMPSVMQCVLRSTTNCGLRGRGDGAPRSDGNMAA